MTDREGVDMPKGTCSVEGCERSVKSRGLCQMHYFRLWRTGTAGEAAPRLVRYATKVCSVDGCEKVRSSGAWCSMHEARVRRHGDPEFVKSLADRELPHGADHHMWKADDVGYHAAHARVRRRRGRASEHLCVDCGAPAQQWSYDHGDPNESTEEMGGFAVPFSADVDHYEPRCIPCHKAFDLAVIASRAA